MQKSSVQRLRQALGGLSGVHVTPYDASGAIAHAQLAKVVDFIAAAGVDNIVTAGNTGGFWPARLNRVVRGARI